MTSPQSPSPSRQGAPPSGQGAPPSRQGAPLSPHGAPPFRQGPPPSQEGPPPSRESPPPPSPPGPSPAGPPPAPRGLLVGGLLLAVVILVAAIVGAAVALGGDSGRDRGGEVAADKLTVGHCVDGLRTGDLSALPVLPCEQPHEGEVFAVFDLPAGPFPGDEALGGSAREECLKRFETYAPSAVADEKIELYYLHPSQLSWGQGDREVTCVATDPGTKRTGSVKG